MKEVGCKGSWRISIFQISFPMRNSHIFENFSLLPDGRWPSSTVKSHLQTPCHVRTQTCTAVKPSNKKNGFLTYNAIKLNLTCSPDRNNAKVHGKGLSRVWRWKYSKIGLNPGYIYSWQICEIFVHTISFLEKRSFYRLPIVCSLRPEESRT